MTLDLSPQEVSLAGRVLIVEDEPDLQALWRAILERAGFTVIEVLLGRQALRVARTQVPNLILLDGHLPDMTGWDVLATIGSDPILRTIPVVMISGESSKDAETRSLRLGAVRYLTKPVLVEDFMQAITEALGADG